MMYDVLSAMNRGDFPQGWASMRGFLAAFFSIRSRRINTTVPGIIYMLEFEIMCLCHIIELK